MIKKIKQITLFFTYLLIVSTAHANERFQFSDDIYQAGQKIHISNSNLDSVFLAGQDISIVQNLSGSAYLAGQIININGDIAQDLFASGQNITINNSILGDIRVAGDNVLINAPVNGDVMIAASRLEINAPISGNVLLFVDKVTFGDAAKILGDLTLYGKHQDIGIPPSVISTERIHYMLVDIEYEDKHEHSFEWGSLLASILFLAGFIFLAAFLYRKITKSAPHQNPPKLRSNIINGFVVLIILAGSIIISAITVIGIPLTVLLSIATPVVAFIGFCLGMYLIVCHIANKISSSDTSIIKNQMVLSLLAAILSILCVNIPWLGYPTTIFITCYGVGSIFPWKFSRSSQQ